MHKNTLSSPSSSPSLYPSTKKRENSIIPFPHKKENLTSRPTLATDGLGWEYRYPSTQMITSLLCVYLHTSEGIDCQFCMCRLASIQRDLWYIYAYAEDKGHDYIEGRHSF